MLHYIHVHKFKDESVGVEMWISHWKRTTYKFKNCIGNSFFL